MTKSQIAIFASASCLIGFALAGGVTLSETGYASLDTAHTLLNGAGFSIAAFIVIALVARWFGSEQGRRSWTGCEALAPSWSAKSVVAHAAIMLACWAVYFVAFAPGTMGFDTFFQIYQFYPDHEPILQIPWDDTESWIATRFCDHHPIFDTLVFGLFGYLSDGLTGSWNAGLALYTVLQMMAMAASFTLLCSYEERLGAHPLLRALSFLFFCLAPFVAMYSVSILKDTLHSWLFVLYFLLCTEIVMTKGALLRRTRWTAALVAASLLLCLTKKTGLYVVVLESMFLLVCYRACWKQLLVAAISAVVLMGVVLPFAVFPALDVTPGGRQEALGVAFQQTARYVSSHGDDVTEEERQAIDRVLPYDSLPELYNAKNQDYVKYRYKWKTATGDDVRDYLLTWARQGIRHPGSYLLALASTLAPYFDPSTAIVPYFDDGYTIDERAKTRFPAATEPLRAAIIGAYDALSQLPFISFLFSNALYAWCIPLAAFALTLAGPRRSRFAPAFFLALLAIGSYLIVPLALSRYVLPLVYLSPLLLALANAASTTSRV